MVMREREMTRKKNELRKIALLCANYLIQNYSVKRVFLIGSVSNGIIHNESDIDLVVEGLESSKYIKTLTEVYDLIPAGIEINLIPFEDCYDSLKEKTLKEGEIIYA